jgi:hypothetical protein
MFEAKGHAVDEQCTTLLRTLPEGEGRPMITQFTAAHAMMDRATVKAWRCSSRHTMVSAAGDRVVAGVDCVPVTLPANAAQTIYRKYRADVVRARAVRGYCVPPND